MWTFGRPNKQAGPPSKKVSEVPNIRTLELTGDLIGHSGAVQVGRTGPGPEYQSLAGNQPSFLIPLDYNY